MGVTKRVLFISGPGRESARYRCDHQREQLELTGTSCDVSYYGDVDPARLVDGYDCFVLYRIPWDRRLARFVDRARRSGRPVLADVDDLVFDPARAHLAQAVTRLHDRERRSYERAIAALRQTLVAVDGVVASTESLRREVSAVNHATAASYNAVSQEMVLQAEAAVESRRRRTPNDGITLAYLSGTPTHDRDFLKAADGVLWALKRYPNVRFLVAGFLVLDDRFSDLSDRVTRAEYRPWQRVPQLIADIDVNLAPLEPGNPFTDAKSCVKYLEAALLGVPTIASPTTDFRRVIADGANGLLADTADDWRQALQLVVESEERRTQIGREAWHDVRAHHTTSARARHTSAAFASLVPEGIFAA